MSPIEAFRAQHPDVFFLDPAELGRLTTHLRTLQVLAADEEVERATRAGDGNMNCTVRVQTPKRSLIVKQAHPWVEKYPQLAAPWDRAVRELEFYQLLAPFPKLAQALPRLLAGDPVSRLLVLEDLGTQGDYTDLYGGAQLLPTELAVGASFLSELHRVFRQSPPLSSLANREMRALNHAHIFVLPFQPNNGLNLDSICLGLAAVALPIRENCSLLATIERLGETFYLADGPCLLHGDFFPGSLVRTGGGPRVIDPEFAFFGRPEFDVGVFLAHLLLSHQPADSCTAWLNGYEPATDFEPAVVLQLAGVEILRRLLGYAQLPLRAAVAERRRLAEQAVELVLNPSLTLLVQP
jgi:5-methylthioribose kinase